MKVIELIANNQLEKAIEKLLVLSQNTDFYDEVVLQSARLKDIKNKEMQGTISPDQESMMVARVRVALLDLAKKLEKGEVTQTPEIMNLEREGLMAQLSLLIEKQNYFRKSEVITSDIAQKFALQQSIRQIEQEIKKIKEKLFPTENSQQNTKMDLKALEDLIDSLNFRDFFKAVENGGFTYNKASFSRFKKEFESGASKNDVDYIDRIKVFLDSIKK